MTKNNRFSPAKIKVRLKGLHKSLTPDPRHLTPVLSTTVMSALQIQLFMQNKAKFQKVKFNVNDVLTNGYDQLDTWSIRKKQSQTKPNKPKSNPILANITTERTQFKPKQTQFRSQIMLNSTIITRPRSFASRSDQIEHDCPGRRIYGQRPKMPNCSIIEMNNRKYLTLMVFGTILALTPSGNLHANPKSSDPIPRRTDLKGWKTNTAKRIIDLNELISAGRAIQGELKGEKLSPAIHGATSLLLGLFSSLRLKSTPGKIIPVGRSFGKTDIHRNTDFVSSYKHNFQHSFRVFTPIKIR